jgi:hypothetical protein
LISECCINKANVLLLGGDIAGLVLSIQGMTLQHIRSMMTVFSDSFIKQASNIGLTNAM